MSVTYLRKNRCVRTPTILTGKALERRFIRAARRNRVVELNDLARKDGALTEKTLVLATSRLSKTSGYVSRAKSVQLVAGLWREISGQSLGVRAAFHIGKKLLNDHVKGIINGTRDAKASVVERVDALTQLLSLVRPELRVTAHAMLLSHLNECAQYERVVLRMRPGDERLSRNELQELSCHRVRRIEQSGFELLVSAAVHATAFDGIDAGYDQLQPSNMTLSSSD